MTTMICGTVEELHATAKALCAPGKGFLASDESAGPWLRAGNADAAKIPDTAENRAAYRSMCYTAPGLSAYISGVILHTETLYQKDANGTPMNDSGGSSTPCDSASASRAATAASTASRSSCSSAHSAL